MHARVSRFLLGVAALLGLVAAGPAADGPATRPATAPATAPASSQPAAAVPDLCRGAVDPYNDVTERGRFFRAAGVDSELTAEEFRAAAGQADSFVRSYDRWDALIVFDKNTNGTIDWFEADAYRRDIRSRMLSAFDADKDRVLRDRERRSANESLARGVVPGRPGSAGATADALLPPAPPSPYYQPDYAALQKKFDADGDGRMSAEEWQALNKHVQAEREKWELDRYDTNKDGTLDAAERKAMNDARAAWAQDMSRRAELTAWDKNRDGRLDEQEQAALNAWKEQIARQAAEARKRYDEMIKKHDADGDGKLDENERKAMYEDYRRQAELARYDANKDGVLDEQEQAEMTAEQERWKRIAELQKLYYQRKYDADGDGVVSPDEQKAVMEEYQRKQIERWDADGDGKLSDAERQVMYKAMQSRYAKIRQRMDVDGDGQISPDEARASERRNLKRYDANKDGWLDPDEQERMNDDIDAEEDEDEGE